VQSVHLRRPESALIDSQEAPALRFIERNCVQCAVREYLPENAIRWFPDCCCR
jgi:hypothetical protein